MSLLAGTTGSAGYLDGDASVARFAGLRGIAADGSGNLYVADGNRVIRRISASGIVTTIAGAPHQSGFGDGAADQARFFEPTAVAIDGRGDLYVLDNQALRRVTPAGVVTTLVPDSLVAGPGTSDTRLSAPKGVAVDGAGSIYVSEDGTASIRRLRPDGRFEMLAGGGGRGTFDGAGGAAQFQNPAGIGADALGNLYVADTTAHTVRRVTPAGDVTTWAGRAGVAGNLDGAGVEATFRFPTDVTVDRAGNVFVVESGAPFQSSIRRIAPDRTVTTIASAGQVSRIAVDAHGALVATAANAVVSLAPAGLRVIAGAALATGQADGTGTTARFGGGPMRLALDRSGQLFVADSANDRIRRVSAEGEVTTLPLAFPTAHSPFSLAFDATGTLYVGSARCTSSRLGPLCTGELHRVGASGAALEAVGLRPGSDGMMPRLELPSALAIDRAGNVYVAQTLEGKVLRVTPQGDVGVFAGGPASPVPGVYDLAFDAAGDLLVAHGDGVHRIAPDGRATPVAGREVTGTATDEQPSLRFYDPFGLAVDSAGIVYVADRESHVVRRIARDGAVAIVAGTPGSRGFVPGGLPGVLDRPHALAVSGASLYIAMSSGIAIIRNLP